MSIDAPRPVYTMRKIIDCAKLIILLFIAYLLFLAWKSYDVRTIPLENFQMAPSCRPEELHIGTRFEHWSELKYGDIVYYNYPIITTRRGDYIFIARILGLPGDRIQWINGKCYRNGIALEEPYVTQENAGQETYPEILIPAHCVYLMVDSRRGTYRGLHYCDSRFLGPLLIESVQGIFRAK